MKKKNLMKAASGSRGAETTAGAATPAIGVQPNRVRSEAKEVEIFPRGKEHSGETAGAVGGATDAGAWGCPCENIHSWISLVGDLAFSHQGGIYGFKFPKRFSGDLFLRSLSFTLF